MIRTHLSSTSPTVPLSSVTPSAVSTSYTNSKRKWFLLYMHTLLKWCNMYFFSFYATVLYTQDNHPHLQFLSHLHVLQTQQIWVVFASIESAHCWANLTKQQIKNYEVTLSLEMFSAKTSRDVHRNGTPDQVAARENQPVEKYRSKEGYAMTF